jgi:hypothetical protein
MANDLKEDVRKRMLSTTSVAIHSFNDDFKNN